MKFRLHHESSVLLNAPAERAFAYLDDFKALSEHMAKPSAMMLGSKMSVVTDDLGGRGGLESAHGGPRAGDDALPRRDCH